jgi:hypothetical protein
MPTHDYDKILGEIHAVKLNLHDLEGKVDDIEKEIKMEIDMKIQRTEWEHANYDKRFSVIEKVLFGAVGIILVTVLGAMLTKIII